MNIAEQIYFYGFWFGYHIPDNNILLGYGGEEIHFNQQTQETTWKFPDESLLIVANHYCLPLE